MFEKNLFALDLIYWFLKIKWNLKRFSQTFFMSLVWFSWYCNCVRWELFERIQKLRIDSRGVQMNATELIVWKRIFYGKRGKIHWKVLPSILTAISNFLATFFNVKRLTKFKLICKLWEFNFLLLPHKTFNNKKS